MSDVIKKIVGMCNVEPSGVMEATCTATMQKELDKSTEWRKKL